MKNLSLALTVFLVATSAFAAVNKAIPSTQVGVRTYSDGQNVVEITISGGKGSKAELLYNSLTQVEEQSDDAMGGRHGSAKQGNGIECDLEADKFAKDSYSCVIKVNPAGASLDPTT